MGEGFHFLDIIFFAMIAAFLVLRLRSVLGRRTGNERRPPETLTRPRGEDKKVVELADRRPRQDADGGTGDESVPDDRDDTAGPRASRRDGGHAGEGPASAGLTQIQVADSAFTPDEFLNGAKAAFEMVIEGFAKGDRDTLRSLANDEVYGNLVRAIEAREKAEQTLETSIVGITGADIVEARMEGRVAFVTVKLVSEQVNLVRDKEGRVLEGDPSKVSRVTDIWTFARNTRSQDPNWTLVETRSEQ